LFLSVPSRFFLTSIKRYLNVYAQRSGSLALVGFPRH